MNRVIDCVGFIHIVERRLLHTLSKGNDTWYLPGGKVDEGETDRQAFAREVKEEVSVAVVDDSVREYGVFEAQAHGKPKGVKVRVVCFEADFTGDLVASREIAELQFIPYDRRHMTAKLSTIVYEDLRKKGLV
jgi:8-oxo-dGTP pyrophosphatase MutT (NUDIX family)